jgi:LysM repeat protein
MESGGKKDVKDGNDVSVSEYINKFAGYDLSNITGKPMGTKPPEIEYINISYIVIEGDNLSKIAKKHNTSIDRIREASKLESDSLKIGQKLIVPEGRPIV